MTRSETNEPGLSKAIWQSCLALPKWVIIWLAFILGPANFGILFFLDQPGSGLIAILIFGGMLLGVIPLIMYRGLTLLIGVGHVLLWTPLVLYLIFARPEGSETYNTYLWILLIVNLISLVFDYNDLARWLGGARSVLTKDNKP